MKKRIGFILTMVILVAFMTVCTSAAESGKCGDNLTWMLDEEGVLSISGTGEMYTMSDYDDAPWYSISRLIRKVVINNGVLSIGDTAFMNCPNLTNITVSENNSKFSSDKYGVLFNKDKTVLIHYPAGNTRTFYEIPNHVTSIDKSAFSNCYNLTNVIISDSVTSIGNTAFYYCYNLTNIKIGNSVTNIGNQAFMDCDNLTSVRIPNSVTSIGRTAFCSCDSLTNMELGDRVNHIGSSAFSGCDSLTSIAIPDSVTMIDDGAFNNCNSLKSIIVNENNLKYCSDKFGVLYNKSKTKLLQYPNGNSRESFEIPSSVTSIDELAFAGCSNLTNIIVPDSVTQIQRSTFAGCSNLTNIIISDSITRIGEYAFSGCSHLTNITIPESVTYIGWRAFYECDNLAINGYEGSYAQAYANENDIPFKVVTNRTYEEYFADNIDGYIDQITGLKLPYAYLAEEADKRGVVSWDLFLENFYGDKLKKDPSSYYKTVLLSILTKEFSSDSYYNSLLNQAGGLAFDTASLILGDMVDTDKEAVENATNIFDKLEKEITLADSESAKYIADLVGKAKKVGKSATDVIDEYSKYRVAKNMSSGMYNGLCMMKDCSDNGALNAALAYIAPLYSSNEALVFGKAYTSEVLPDVLQGVWKDAVANDAVLGKVMSKFEIAGGQLEKAYDLAKFSIDMAQFGSDSIYPVTNMSESIMKLQSVYVIESYAKQALVKANEQYKANPTKENALTVVGLYDFLMTVYDYGMNEATVYAKYYYDHGLLNAITDIFSNNNQREYKDTISWINSYNGALNDVKWYRTKTEIEYGFETGTLVPVVVNTYFAGKVVDSVADIISNGSIYNPPAGGTLNLPTFFNDITLSVTTSGYYYDSAFTKPYVATNLTTPVTLYKQVTIQRHPRVVVNGQEVTFPDQKPIIEDGRTLVPARGVFEALGATVSWDGNTSTAVIKTDSKDIAITIGQRHIVVNAKRIPIDVPAKIINGRTMIPLRAVAEALECEVGWDGATYTATINSK